jgi:acetyltransferase-like isoleucine patch superfamily enzyme
MIINYLYKIWGALLFVVFKDVKLLLFQKKWRKLNKHNFIEPANIFDYNLVEVGIGTLGHLNIISFGNKEEKLIIGNYCTIARNVEFLLGGEHNFNNLTTFEFSVKYLKQSSESMTKGPIIIGNDVWIGRGSTILSGVHIGNGAVIGACTVVRKNVPPYAIVIGNPMRIAGYRYTEEIIQILEEIKLYDRLSLKVILKNIDLFEGRPSKEILDKITDLIKRTNI